MARRRKGRKSTRRRSKPKFNILNAAQTALVANVVTKNVFNANLGEFITGSVGGAYRPGSDGSTVLTAPELLGFSRTGWSANNIGGQFSSGYTLTSVIGANLGNNIAPILTGVVGIPIAFKLVKQLAGKPLINPANRALKMVGVTGVKF